MLQLCPASLALFILTKHILCLFSLKLLDVLQIYRPDGSTRPQGIHLQLWDTAGQEK